MGSCQDDSLDKDKQLEAKKFLQAAKDAIKENPQLDKPNDSLKDEEGVEMMDSLAKKNEEADVKLKEELCKYREEQRKGLESDRKNRRWLAWAIYVLVFLYVVAVMCVLFMDGYGSILLSDSVLITMLSTTTANVLGVLVIVATYYFASKNRSKKNK